MRGPRHSRAPIIVLSAIAFVAVAALLFVLLFDFAGVFERRASTALAKPVTVASAHLRLFPLRLVLHDLTVAPDPKSNQTEPLLHAGDVDATLAFWRLLAGEVLLPRLAIDDATARVERDASGATNWDPPGKKPERKPLAAEPELPKISDLSLHNTRLAYRDKNGKTDLALSLETKVAGGSTERTLVVTGKGTYEGAATTINMSGGSILALREPTQPYPLDLHMTSGATDITVKGTVVDPANMKDMDVALTVKGDDASDLYRIAGIALPPTPAYTITTRLDRDGKRWLFKRLAWKMGASDLAGDMSWDLSGKKPKLEGKLTANTLDLDDLAGFIGAAPGHEKTPLEVKQAAAQRERAVRGATEPPPAPTKDQKTAPKQPEVAKALVIPDRPLDLEKINSMNAAVHLDARQVVNAGLPLDNLTADLSLNDGVLRLKPLNFGADAGRIAMTVAINAAKEPVHTDATVDITNYPLDRLVGKAVAEALAKKNTTFGAIGGRIDLHGDGNSTHRVLATSNGTVGLIAQGGQISDLMVQLMGLNIAKTIGLLLSGDKPVPIRCMAADFNVENGVMKTQAFVVDTEPSIITGDGTVDLGGELLKLRLHAKPKSGAVGSLRVPIEIGGSFEDPSFGPNAGALALRGGAAAALGVVLTPLGALLATIDAGGGKDADCAKLFSQVAEDTGKDLAKSK